MNLRLDIAIRDVAGKSGLAIIEAILAGNRDAEYLASLVDTRVKKSKEEIADSLKGWWRKELLYELKAALEFYKLYEKALVDCDKTIEQALIKYAPQPKVSGKDEKEVKATNKKNRKHAPSFDVSQIAVQYFGTDLFAIPGISHTTVLCLLTNMGHDIHKFSSRKSFAAWLRLVPNNKVSGGKIISNSTAKGKNYIAIALRQAANSIGNQKDHDLTPFFKRIAFRKGRVAAVTATARKLAIIIWNMITKVQPYKKNEIVMNNERHKATHLKQIESRIGTLQLNRNELTKFFERASLLIN